MGKVWRIGLFSTVLLLGAIVWVVGSWPNWQVSHLLSQASLALRQRDSSAARPYLSRALERDPANGKALLLLARVERREGDFGAARELLQRASLSGVDPALIRREEWILMAQMGQLTESLPRLYELLKQGDDESEDICEALVNGLFLGFRFSEAFSVLDAWQKDYPHDPLPHVFRGLFAERNQRLKEVVEHFQKAHRLGPKRRDIQLRLANALVATGNLDDASPHFAQLVEQSPNTPGVWSGYAKFLRQSGEIEAAQKALEFSERQESEAYDTQTALGQIALDQNRLDDALSHLERAIKIDGANPEARLALASALQKLGRLDEAKVHFRKANDDQQSLAQLLDLQQRTVSDPANLDARYQIAEIYHQQEKPAERLAWLRSIIEIAPKESRAYLLLAQHYFQIGDKDTARIFQLKGDALRGFDEHLDETTSSHNKP